MFLIQQTRHPCPERKPRGVCEIAMTRPTSVLTAGVSLIHGCLVVGTLAGVAMAGGFFIGVS